MKNKIKNYLKIGILLLGISLTLVNCQKDDFEIENPQQIRKANFNITEIGVTKIQENKNISSKLSKLKEKLSVKKNNAQNKEVYSSEYDFTINTDYATYIESSDGLYHSYTFPITRETDNEIIENLLVSLQPDGTYKMSLITYNFTNQEKQDYLNGQDIDLSGKVNSSIINNEGIISDIFSKTSPGCTWVIHEFCGKGNHPGGYDGNKKCPEYNNEVDILCSTGTGGGDDYYSNNTTGGYTNDGTSYGSSTTSDSQDVTVVTVTPNNPCKELKDLSDLDKLNLDSEIEFLKEKLANDTQNEWSVNFSKKLINGTSPYEYNYHPNTQEEGLGGTSELLTGGYNYGSAHIHTKKGFGMFSWGDVKKLSELYNDAVSYNRPAVTLILVCYNPNIATEPEMPYNIYALKVDDKKALTKNTDDVWNGVLYGDIIDQEDRIEKILKDEAERMKVNGSHLEKYFLEYYEDYGISIYKANTNLSDWNKLGLSPVGNTGTQVVTSTPCNN